MLSPLSTFYPCLHIRKGRIFGCQGISSTWSNKAKSGANARNNPLHHFSTCSLVLHIQRQHKSKIKVKYPNGIKEWKKSQKIPIGQRTILIKKTEKRIKML